MSFEQLEEFVNDRMRMSHVYQPVMLRTLLRQGGEVTDRDIAKAILYHDESQIEYYRKTTNEMVGRVLRNHDLVEKTGSTYRLVGYDELKDWQREYLQALCKKRLQRFKQKRGEDIWEHRKKSSGYISGTIRYEVLKKAKYHCELCGISADERALEVDHILPRSKGGSDDISNLQALCYSCNAMKRDRDDTDFREVRDAYRHREEGCLFCEKDQSDIIEGNRLAYVVWDGYPVTEGHALIVPRRHAQSYFELGRPEINACNALLEATKDQIETEGEDVEGFNVGINDGRVAGQTILHCHIHLIPRGTGDVDDPRGGVRHTIPGKGHYSDDGVPE